MLAHPAHLISMGFGMGLSPAGPGTIGSIAASPLYHLMSSRHEPLVVLLVACFMFLLGAWACGKTGRDLGVPDHGCMVWDEIVAMLVVLSFLPASIWWQLAGFALFRVFDILKPPPVRQIDTRIKGGLGVMLDDSCAAFYALIVLAISKIAIG